MKPMAPIRNRIVTAVPVRPPTVPHEAVRALAAGMLAVLIEQDARLGPYEPGFGKASWLEDEERLDEAFCRSRKKTEVAKALGVSRSTLYRRLARQTAGANR